MFPFRSGSGETSLLTSQLDDDDDDDDDDLVFYFM